MNDADRLALRKPAECKDRGNKRALGNRGLILDCIEFADHLRQTPGPERGKNDNTEQFQRLRTEEGSERAVQTGVCFCRNTGKCIHRFHESAVIVQNSGDNNDNTEEHDNTLNKVVDSGSHVAAGNDIHTGQHTHNNNAPNIVDAECGLKQSGQTVVQRSSVRNEENKNTRGCDEFERFGIEAVAEVFGHGCRTDVLGHQTGSSAEKHPCEKRTDDRIADADPCCGNAVFPAELSGVADEDNRGKIGSTIGKGSQPRTYTSSSQYKVIHISGKK